MESVGSGGKREFLDVLGTGLAAVVLLATGCWNLMTVASVPKIREMFAEMEGAALPLVSGLVFRAAEFHLFHVFSVAMLLSGFALLFATGDRLRGIVYCLSVSMLFAVVTVLIKEAAMLPMVKIIQSVG